MVPPSSHRVSRVRWYSGYRCLLSHFTYRAFTFCGLPSHAIPLCYRQTFAVHTPEILLPPVWPLPRSLAATWRISVDFFSSAYLDVSVQRVYLRIPIYSVCGDAVLTAPGCPIRTSTGHYAYLRLTVAFRSLSRPSSAPDAKAFPLRSF